MPNKQSQDSAAGQAAINANAKEMLNWVVCRATSNALAEAQYFADHTARALSEFRKAFGDNYSSAEYAACTEMMRRLGLQWAET